MKQPPASLRTFSESPASSLESTHIKEILHRPRRNRRIPAIRNLVQETHLSAHHLISPLFVWEAFHEQEIPSMPGVFRYPLQQLLHEAEQLMQLGICALNLFCYTPQSHKDYRGSEALRSGNLMQKSIALLKKEFPELCVIVDIALDPFTDHGHDGIVDRLGRVINDATVENLAKMSLLAAEAGADIVAPSDMMDGRVGYIRKVLDQHGFWNVGILSYAAKYASSFYGPFRDALDSAPQFGDKKTYQMNPSNSREALWESFLDEQEGADMLLIKPALAYLDIISKVKGNSYLPVGAYHVSGEYAMVKAAAQKGWLNEDAVFFESLLSIRRAGADFILSYAAQQVARTLMHDRKNSFL